jgi:adenylate cyclase
MRSHLTDINFSGNLLEQAYFTETLNSERLRVTILAGLLGFVVIALLILFSFFQEEYRQLFKDNQAIYSLFIYILFIITYELLVRYILGKRSATYKKPSVFLRYLKAFLETSMPTILLIIIIHSSEQILILQGPAVLTYFLFIILATLRLDFSICLFTGFIAAVEYISISVIYTNYFNLSSTGILVNTNILYFGNGVMMITAGIAAGFVANQIKLKMHKSYKTIQEKNEIVNYFGQQISQQIADEILAHRTKLKSKRKNVCVMFLDIRNFTPFAEHQEPEEVVEYLNKLFGFMIEIVNQHHGIINQFLGDGFMATFGAPVSYGNNSQYAVDAALMIIDRIKVENEKGLYPQTRIGIGLHSGEAVTGNIGTSLRKQYSITGNVVILASRIEQLNKKYHSQLMISEEVYSQANNLPANFVSLGTVNVKGHEEPISLYRLS